MADIISGGKYARVEKSIGGRTLSFETGKVARQANAAVMCKLSASLLMACALLAGCGEEPAVTEPEDDPLLRGALNEPIMVDPDLVGQNRANSAAALPSQDDSLPTVDSKYTT